MDEFSCISITLQVLVEKPSFTIKKFEIYMLFLHNNKHILQYRPKYYFAKCMNI